MLYFTLIMIVLFIIFFIFAYIYRNPYKLYICIGKKGSGKSTFITKRAYQLTKRKKNVYTNMVLNLPKKNMEYVHYVGALDLWCTDLDGCTVFLDETSLEFNCQDWATFPREMKQFFVFQRKKHCTVYLFSQNLNVDKTIRDLADNLILFRCLGGFISAGRYINRKIVFTKASDFKGSTIADELHPSLRVNFTFIPRWKKYFNTDDTTFIASNTERKKR